jgi:hypothetical protein
MTMHLDSDKMIAVFIVLSAAVAIFRIWTEDEILNESESAASELSEPTKSTLGIRLLVTIVSLVIGGVANLEVNHEVEVVDMRIGIYDAVFL